MRTTWLLDGLFIQHREVLQRNRIIKLCNKFWPYAANAVSGPLIAKCSHQSGKHILVSNLQVAEKATTILTIFVSLTAGFELVTAPCRALC